MRSDKVPSSSTSVFANDNVFWLRSYEFRASSVKFRPVFFNIFVCFACVPMRSVQQLRENEQMRFNEADESPETRDPGL